MIDFSNYLLKTDEATKMLKCDRRVIYALRDLGVLVPIRIGKADCYRFSALESFVEHNFEEDFSRLDRYTPEGAQRKFGRYK